MSQKAYLNAQIFIEKKINNDYELKSLFNDKTKEKRKFFIIIKIRK